MHCLIGLMLCCKYVCFEAPETTRRNFISKSTELTRLREISEVSSCFPRSIAAGQARPVLCSLNHISPGRQTHVDSTEPPEPPEPQDHDQSSQRSSSQRQSPPPAGYSKHIPVATKGKVAEGGLLRAISVCRSSIRRRMGEKGAGYTQTKVPGSHHGQCGHQHITRCVWSATSIAKVLVF